MLSKLKSFRNMHRLRGSAMTIKRKKILAYSIVSLIGVVYLVRTFLLYLTRPLDTLSVVIMTLSVFLLPVHWFYVFLYFRLKAKDKRKGGV